MLTNLLRFQGLYIFTTWPSCSRMHHIKGRTACNHLSSQKAFVRNTTPITFRLKFLEIKNFLNLVKVTFQNPMQTLYFMLKYSEHLL